MRDAVIASLQVLLLLVVASLALGAVLGQPIGLSYVETDSMAPTLSPGDGFVAVPSAVAGDVETGDLVVFRAERLHGGGLTTHRVVGETESGYVTRGDANPSTDQAGDEPPVKDSQVVAHALQVGGKVVVIPHLGTVVVGMQDLLVTVRRWIAVTVGVSLAGPQSLALSLLAVSAVVYGWDLGQSRTARTRNRPRENGRDVRVFAVAIVGAVLLGATAAMVVPAGPTEYGFVSSMHDTRGADVIGVGGTETTDYATANPGVVPVVVILETDGDRIALDRRAFVLGSGERTETTVTLSAPPHTGYVRQYVVQHRYLAVFPLSTTRWLHSIHPWLPVVLVDAAIGIPAYVLARWTLGSGRLRERLRDRELPISTRVRRWVKARYRGQASHN